MEKHSGRGPWVAQVGREKAAEEGQAQPARVCRTLAHKPTALLPPHCPSWGPCRSQEPLPRMGLPQEGWDPLRPWDPQSRAGGRGYVPIVVGGRGGRDLPTASQLSGLLESLLPSFRGCSLNTCCVLPCQALTVQLAPPSMVPSFQGPQSLSVR